MMKKNKATTLIEVLIGVLLLARTASADIINVPADFPTIQTAIDTALGGDEIIVAPGTYFENINFLGKAIALRSTDPSDPAVVAATIIDATGLGQVSVVTCNTSEESDTILSGFTVTGGTGTDPGNGFRRGGGMYIVSSSPTVSDCTFSGNTATSGGGMYSAAGSSPTVTNCTFSENTAGSRGGGMYHHASDPTVSNCTFSGNTADFGGGMFNRRSSLTVTNCTFNANTALGGGGMRNSSSSPSVTNCTFNANTAIDGGGMSNFTFSTPTVTNCTFHGNAATFGGGGGMTNHHSCPTVTNCAFNGNTAGTRGGGMCNFRSSPSVTNCTFMANQAACGGGIQNVDSCLMVINSTFSANDADNGAALGFDGYGVFGPSELSMTNCILWDGGGEVWNNDNSVINVAYSDVQGGWAGEGNIDADPLFVDSGFWDDNGTPKIPDDDFWVEGDYHVLAGSPCIDAGDNTAVPDSIITDFDGNPRFVDDPDTPDTGNPDGIHPIVDMGAYEFGSPDLCADDDGDGKVTICHSPPGNPDNARTISVHVNAVPAHLAHGDYCGACQG